LPVISSKTTHPRDQISDCELIYDFSPFASGGMYQAVPAGLTLIVLFSKVQIDTPKSAILKSFLSEVISMF